MSEFTCLILVVLGLGLLVLIALPLLWGGMMMGGMMGPWMMNDGMMGPWGAAPRRRLTGVNRPVYLTELLSDRQVRWLMFSRRR